MKHTNQSQHSTGLQVLRSLLAPATLLAFLTACLGTSTSTDNSNGSAAVGVSQSNSTTAEQSVDNLSLPSFDEVLNPAFLKVGEGIDAPGRIEFDLPIRGNATGPCADNTGFLFGSGLHDVTGPVANTGGAG